VAVVDAGDPFHPVCVAALPTLRAPLVTTWPCLTEAMYLLHRVGGFVPQKALWGLRRSGTLVVHATTEAEADRMEALMEQYRDTPMDIADASLVAAAEALGLRRVFTLDRHFHAYRIGAREAFEVIP
jgi:predicted nucleic acid-binding protein